MPREFLKEGSRVLDSWGSGHLAVAIDIAAFSALDDFFDQIDVLAGQLRSARPPATATACGSPATSSAS